MIEKITASLEKAILSGQYARVEKLPSLAQMAKQYRVSYGTARQAVALLARKGLVSMEPGRGTFVRACGLFNFAWVWFGDGQSSHASGMATAALDYTQDYDRLGKHKDVILEMMFLNVRHLPAAKAMADACRIKGVDGLLLNGHGGFFDEYVEELARHLPVATPFSHFEGKKASCVRPDLQALLQEVLGDWQQDKPSRLGFIAPGMVHPNYRRLHRLVKELAPRHGMRLAQEDTFTGADHDMTNWVAGRMLQPNCPDHWVTVHEGAFKAVRQAARIAGGQPGGSDKPGKAFKALTFSVLPQTLRQLGDGVCVALHDYSRTIETALEHLKAVRSGKARPGAKIDVPMTLHRLE